MDIVELRLALIEICMSMDKSYRSMENLINDLAALEDYVLSEVEPEIEDEDEAPEEAMKENDAAKIAEKFAPAPVEPMGDWTITHVSDTKSMDIGEDTK